MIAIRVYGKLAKFLKARVFHADVASPAEAVRFLVANFPGVEAHIAENKYRVFAGRYITEEEVPLPSGSSDIRIAPVIQGAGGVGRIIAGAALIGLSFIPGFQLLGSIGAGLVLGGIAQLLSPVPRLRGSETDPGDPRKNYSFSAVQNTSRQGVPIPIVYGRCLVGSIVISANTDLSQVKA